MPSTTFVDLTRWQFATTAAFHTTFPALSVGQNPDRWPAGPSGPDERGVHKVLSQEPRLELRAGERWCSCRGMLLVNRAHSTGTLSQLVPRAGSAPPILATGAFTVPD